MTILVVDKEITLYGSLRFFGNPFRACPCFFFKF